MPDLEMDSSHASDRIAPFMIASDTAARTKRDRTTAAVLLTSNIVKNFTTISTWHLVAAPGHDGVQLRVMLLAEPAPACCAAASEDTALRNASRIGCGEVNIPSNRIGLFGLPAGNTA